MKLWRLPELQPLATRLFDAVDGEWLVVAPDGSHDASEHGGELAGWRISQPWVQLVQIKPSAGTGPWGTSSGIGQP